MTIPDFYPRSPCGERLFKNHIFFAHSLFLSTLSLRRATRDIANGEREKHISIHALLAESDTGAGNDTIGISHFYPRSPCGERPTHQKNPSKLANFYPRSPCGERPLRQLQFALRRNFYPRSPCGERRGWTLNINGPMKFLSTLSLRRATLRKNLQQLQLLFLSTLSLRRATHLLIIYNTSQRNFYPRSPCGERLLPVRLGCQSFLFLSTLSLRRATAEHHANSQQGKFLSTLSLRRATAEIVKTSNADTFLSTLSLRRATYQRQHTIHPPQISIHALLAESDRGPQNTRMPSGSFLSTLSLRRATA